MKRVLVLSFLLLLVLSSCEQRKKKESSLVGRDSLKIEHEVKKELYGNWVGDFDVDEELYELLALNDDLPQDFDYNPKINLSLKRITADTVLGQNVVKGNMRPLIGRMEENGASVSFIMDEPGDKGSDGRFEFRLKGDTLIGTWTAFDNKVKIKKRKFKLLKKQFAYNPNLMLPNEVELVDWKTSERREETVEDGDSTITFVNDFYRAASDAVFSINASKQKLTEAELKNLKRLDLEIIRNTIFARHGYAFTKSGVRQFFDPVEWYVPVSNEVSQELTQLEKDNISLLKKFEKYAEDNYDYFGR